MSESNPDGILAAAAGRIAAEAAGVQSVADQLDAAFVRVVELILALPGKVFITGSGTSGIMARRMAHLLTVCGTPALYLPPLDALHGGMGVVRAGDLLIAISRGGASAEINDLARRVQQVGVPVIALTSAPTAELAQLADISVMLPRAGGIDPGDVIAMGSTLAVGAWGDALAYVLMIRRGHSWQQVLHNHPAGAVGQITAPPPALGLPGQPD